jgi:hypothetical protein
MTASLYRHSPQAKFNTIPLNPTPIAYPLPNYVPPNDFKPIYTPNCDMPPKYTAKYAIMRNPSSSLASS